MKDYKYKSYKRIHKYSHASDIEKEKISRETSNYERYQRKAKQTLKLLIYNYRETIMDKEKNIKKLFVIVDIVIVILSFLSFVITDFITGQNQSNGIFYFDGVKMWQSPSYYIVSIICLLVFPIILFLQLKKDIKNMILCFCIGIITILLSLFIYLLFSGSGDRSERYYNFASPITGKAMVAEEWSWLQGGGVNFYEPIDEEKMHCIGYISTDDGYRPIEDNSYSLKWSEDEVTIYFSFRGRDKDEAWQTETLKFSTKK